MTNTELECLYQHEWTKVSVNLYTSLAYSLHASLIKDFLSIIKNRHIKLNGNLIHFIADELPVCMVVSYVSISSEYRQGSAF